jgi:membrane fusion protein (multidrug efflux system)
LAEDRHDAASGETRRDAAAAPPHDDPDRDGESTEKTRSGDDGQRDGRRSGMGPRRRRRFILIAALVVVVVAVGALLWWLHARNYEDTDDAYVDVHIVHVSPQIAGRVQRIHASDNMRVHAGDLLVEIDPADASAHLDQAMAQEAQAKAQLAQARADLSARQANYEQARASARGVAAQAANATHDLERYRGLQMEMPAAVAARQLDEARTTAINAAAQSDTADKQVRAAAAQVDAARTQVAGAEAAVKTAQAQVRQAQISLGYTRVVAPIDGTIANESVAAGNTVSPGTEMLAIVPFDVWVTANFKETQLDLMKPGQQVDIKVDAYPDIAFHGHVDSIQRGAGQAFQVLPAQNATGNFIKVVQRVPVKIIIDGPTDAIGLLGPGMSVNPRVHVR